MWLHFRKNTRMYETSNMKILYKPIILRNEKATAVVTVENKNKTNKSWIILTLIEIMTVQAGNLI